MKDTIPPRATLHAGVPPVGCGVGAPPTCGDELPKKTVASLRIWLSDSSRRILALSSLISASSSLVRPSRSPASTSAWRTHRRTDSLPTPTLRAAASQAAVNVGYSCRCSVTNRTARAFNSSSIFLAMSNILSTQKDAAQNPGRFTGSIPARQAIDHAYAASWRRHEVIGIGYRYHGDRVMARPQTARDHRAHLPARRHDPKTRSHRSAITARDHPRAGITPPDQHLAFLENL